MADPTFRAASALASTAGTSRVQTPPTGTVVGDATIYLVFSIGGAAIAAPDATFVQLGTQLVDSTVRCSAWFKKWTGTPANATFTSAGASFTGSGAYSAQGSDLQLIPGAQLVLTTAATAILTGSVTTNVANSLLVAMGTATTAVCSYTPGTMTERSDPGDGGYIADEILAAAGASGTRTLTASTSINAIMILVGIQSNPYAGDVRRVQQLSPILAQ